MCGDYPTEMSGVANIFFCCGYEPSQVEIHVAAFAQTTWVMVDDYYGLRQIMQTRVDFNGGAARCESLSYRHLITSRS